MFGASSSASSSATPASGLFGGFKPPTSGNLFGSTSAPSPGLFGASNTTTSAPQAGGKLFGAATTASTPQVGGNLFGPSTTSQTTGGSLFGSAVNNSTPQTTAGGSLFGSNSNNPPPQTTGGNLFGSTANNNPTGGSLFGSTANNPTPQTTGGSLFGSTANNNPTGGSLFGNNSTAAASSTPSTLFGNSNQAAPTQTTSSRLFGNFNQNSSTASNLFGANNAGNLLGSTQTNATAPASSNLFGPASNHAAPQTGGSLFGSNAPAANSTLFGNSNQTAPTQTTSLFGNANQNSSTPNLFGSTLGNSQNNSVNLGSSFGNKSSGVPVTPASSGVSQNNPIFTRTTRFNDLPDDAKKQLEMLDSMIQTQCRHSDHLKAMKLGTEITEGTTLLRQVTSEMHATSASVTNSTNLLDSIRQAIDTDVSDLLKLAAIVEAHAVTQRLPHNPSSEPLPNPTKFQHEFFAQKCAEMEDRVKRYRQTIEFVDLQLKGLFDRPSPASIVPALKAQYSTFMALADKVAQLNSSLLNLKEDYREIWRHQTGSVRDPFVEVDRFFGLGHSSSLTNFQPC